MIATLNETIAELMVKHRAQQFTLLKKLVQTVTKTRGAGLMKAADEVAGLLEGMEFEVERLAPDADMLEVRGRPPLPESCRQKTFRRWPRPGTRQSYRHREAHPLDL